MKKKLRVAILMGCILLVAGCGDKEKQEDTSAPAPKESASTSPLQALENMRLALLAGDKEAFADCFEDTAEQKEMLEVFAEFTITANQFKEAMIKAYGEEEVKQAMGDRKQGMDLDDENWLDEVKIEIEGDTATAAIEGESQVLNLVKTEGLWKIDAASMFGPMKGQGDEDMEQATKMFQTMGKVMKDVQQKIGQEGYTAEKINQELGQAMMMAMMQAAGAEGLPLPKE